MHKGAFGCAFPLVRPKAENIAGSNCDRMMYIVPTKSSFIALNLSLAQAFEWVDQAQLKTDSSIRSQFPALQNLGVRLKKLSNGCGWMSDLVVVVHSAPTPLCEYRQTFSCGGLRSWQSRREESITDHGVRCPRKLFCWKETARTGR